MNLERSVEKRLRAWVPTKARLLCAVSGGPDSVALAHALKRLSYPLVIGHVDHRIRKASHRDATFVQKLATRWNLPYKETQVDVPAKATAQGMGLEEAAREARYAALCSMARETGCSVIVTGHTEDDQAETVLMNFLRGAGPTGLAGIPPARVLSQEVMVVRPLLTTPRHEIVSYLRSHRLPSRQDPSNRSARFTRNRIRHTVLPLLEQQYPGLRKRLVQMAEIFREEQGLWAGQIEREFNKTVRQNNKKITIDLPRLLGYHKALGRRILRHSLTGISFQDTERVFQLALSAPGNTPVSLPGGLQIERKEKELIISRGTHE